MKFKLFLIGVSVTVLMWAFSTAVIAREEIPSPYSGVKNPFPWGDAVAQEAGKKVYQRSCQGCHGLTGANIASADFSTADFASNLETMPDYYFWELSEGRMEKGMPPFKSSLSEEQRWQTLTYLWRLAETGGTKATATSTSPSTTSVNGNLTLAAPTQAVAGQPMTLSATLKDEQGKPLDSVVVEFLVQADFFTQGLMKVGEAVTDSNGVATYEFSPRETGETEVVASYGNIKTTSTVVLSETTHSFYEPEAGLSLPAPGNDVLIGPKSATELGAEGNAPMTAFRLPGGILSWLLIPALTIMFIWFTYFRVIYQVFRIPINAEMGETNTRLIPTIGLAMVVLLGILLIAMFLTGPYSHLHLSR
ncbi:MAG: c-type cytochrome [Chloroflexi bacterium]|nr:c-type cytochrome [Chloroflexota bacterium]